MPKLPEKSKKSNKSNINVIEPNKAKTESNKKPTTLAEFYAHAYKVVFNKLSKEEKDELLINLSKVEPVIRGQSRQFPNVRQFIKTVAELGEELFVKSQTSKI